MPLESSKNDRDIQSIHSAPKMRPTALEMAKNQGLDSVLQNKKNKNKKFREKAAEGHVVVYRDAPICKWRPFLTFRSAKKTDIFVTYIAKTNEAPAGSAAGLLRGCCCAPTGAGLLLRGCCYGYGRSETGAGGLLPVNGERGTWHGANVPESPIIPINNSLLITYI